jgi:hypothetical protein
MIKILSDELKQILYSGLGAGAVPQTDGQTWSPYNAFFPLFCKERLTISNHKIKEYAMRSHSVYAAPIGPFLGSSCLKVRPFSVPQYSIIFTFFQLDRS